MALWRARHTRKRSKQMMFGPGLGAALLHRMVWQATLRRALRLRKIYLLETQNQGRDLIFPNAEFFDEHGKKWPLMCMGYRIVGLNRWKEPVSKGSEIGSSCVRFWNKAISFLYHGETILRLHEWLLSQRGDGLPRVTLSSDYDAHSLMNRKSNSQIFCSAKNDEVVPENGNRSQRIFEVRRY